MTDDALSDTSTQPAEAAAESRHRAGHHRAVRGTETWQRS